MTPHMKWGIAGVIVGLILLGFIPFWLAGLLIIIAIAIPAGAWLMLDESQRRRYREIRRRQRGQVPLGTAAGHGGALWEAAPRKLTQQLAIHRRKEAQMAVRRLNHAVLYVHGLDRTVDFYRTTLGFEVRLEIPGRAAFLRAPGSANDHDLGPVRDRRRPRPDRPADPGLYHLAWEVGTLADLADARAKLVAADALVGESDHRVSKSLYAKDPSGIEFEVLWRVPAEDWAAETADGDILLPLDLERRDRPLGPGPGDRRGGRLAHLSPPTVTTPLHRPPPSGS